jgi:hypothetical protein
MGNGLTNQGKRVIDVAISPVDSIGVLYLSQEVATQNRPVIRSGQSAETQD